MFEKFYENDRNGFGRIVERLPAQCPQCKQSDFFTVTGSRDSHFVGDILLNKWSYCIGNSIADGVFTTEDIKKLPNGVKWRQFNDTTNSHPVIKNISCPHCGYQIQEQDLIEP